MSLASSSCVLANDGTRPCTRLRSLCALRYVDSRAFAKHSQLVHKYMHNHGRTLLHSDERTLVHDYSSLRFALEHGTLQNAAPAELVQTEFEARRVRCDAFLWIGYEADTCVLVLHRHRETWPDCVVT
jgi:hypothetical protein